MDRKEIAEKYFNKYNHIDSKTYNWIMDAPEIDVQMWAKTIGIII